MWKFLIGAALAGATAISTILSPVASEVAKVLNFVPAPIASPIKSAIFDTADVIKVALNSAWSGIGGGVGVPNDIADEIVIPPDSSASVSSSTTIPGLPDERDQAFAKKNSPPSLKSSKTSQASNTTKIPNTPNTGLSNDGSPTSPSSKSASSKPTVSKPDSISSSSKSIVQQVLKTACPTSPLPSAPPTHAVLISEIAWMGSSALSGESASKAGMREWIELKNNIGVPVDLSGYQLVDAAGSSSAKIDLTIQKGALIPSGGFYLLARNGGPGASTTLPGIYEDAGYSGTLSNSGGSLILFNSYCGVIDEVMAPDKWFAGDNATKRTMERDAAGFGWHTSALTGGTPRTANSIPPVSNTSSNNNSGNNNGGGNSGGGGSGGVSNSSGGSNNNGDNNNENGNATGTEEFSYAPIACVTSTGDGSENIVIAEVRIATASSTDDDFIKLFNASPREVAIGGWQLKKKSSSGTVYSIKTIPEGEMIAPYGFFVWVSNAGPLGADASQSNIGQTDIVSSESLSTNNSVALFDASSTLIDALGWGSGTDQYAEGSSFSANPKPDQILKRKIGSDGDPQDTGNNANDFTL